MQYPWFIQVISEKQLPLIPRFNCYMPLLLRPCTPVFVSCPLPSCVGLASPNFRHNSYLLTIFCVPVSLHAFFFHVTPTSMLYVRGVRLQRFSGLSTLPSYLKEKQEPHICLTQTPTPRRYFYSHFTVE